MVNHISILAFQSAIDRHQSAKAVCSPEDCAQMLNDVGISGVRYYRSRNVFTCWEMSCCVP